MPPSTRQANILTIDPHVGWKRFVKGLAVFFVGLLLLLLGSSSQPEVLYLGTVVLLCGFIYALSGYIPMLMHRLGAAKQEKDRFKSRH